MKGTIRFINFSIFIGYHFILKIYYDICFGFSFKKIFQIQNTFSIKSKEQGGK